MSRTRLTGVTALVLVGLAGATLAARYATGGVDVSGLPGMSSWEVTVTTKASSVPGKAFRLVISNPPSFRHQHVFEETYESDTLVARDGRAAAAKGGRAARKTTLRPVTNPMAGAGAQEYTVVQRFHCTLGVYNPDESMRAGNRLDAKPSPDKDHTLDATSRIECRHIEVVKQAQELSKGQPSSDDQYRAFLQFVRGLPGRDGHGTGSGLECLRKGGDEASRVRLLVALCRARDIPARVVTAVNLKADGGPRLHHWAEAWIADPTGTHGQWVPADPTLGHYGTRGWPQHELVVRLDDDPLVRGTGVDPRVTVGAQPYAAPGGADESPGHTFWQVVSFASLPPAEQHLVRFILVLPIGALVVSFFRVMIGIKTFGVFTPALLGLIFRDTRALPWGLGIFAGTVVVGWVFRKVLDRYSLLMVPRTAVLLTMVCLFLLAVVILAARFDVYITGYVALFPLVILTHMVERFWTVEVEDGTQSAFKTLLGTLFVAVAVALVVGHPAVSRWMFRFPETLAVVVAATLLLGRYTGYRLTELYRFQDVIELQPAPVKGPPLVTHGKVAPHTGNGTAEASPAPTAETPALPAAASAPAGRKT